MARPLAIVAAALTVFAGVNLALSAGRALSASDAESALATAPTTVAVPSPPPATVPMTIVNTLVGTPTPGTPPTSPTAGVPTPVESGPLPEAPVTTLEVVMTGLPVAGAPAAFLAATVPTRGIGCAAEPFASAFTLSGFTPAEVDVGSCEIVLDIPGRVPNEQVCAQVSGAPVARSIHVAQRTIDSACRRDPLGVVIHEIGHAWHMADPARFYRVLTSFGLDPRADASLEVVAECFVEAVGYLDTDCGPQGVTYVRTEMDASRAGR